MPLSRFSFMNHLAHLVKVSRHRVPPHEQMVTPTTLYFRAKRQDLFQCNPHLATPELLEQAKKPPARLIDQPQFIKTMLPRR